MKDNVEEEVMTIIKEGHDFDIENDVDISTIIDRWVSNILSLNEVEDETTEEAVYNTQIALAHTAAVMLTAVNAAPILVPLIVNPLLEDATIRQYINDWAKAVPAKETDETVTTLDIIIERN